MNIQLFYYYLTFHLFLSIIYAVFIIFGKSALRKEQVILIFFVPIFGIFGGLISELLHYYGKHGSRPTGLEGFLLGENDIYWKTLNSQAENDNIVPLEEAVLISDIKIRRKLVLDTLYEDPMKYMNILMIARHNEDIETSHYATTTISTAQRQYQLEVQSYSAKYENDSDNIDLINSYINVLGDYIESGLMEDYLLYRQRILYENLISKILKRFENDKNLWIRKLRNSLELGDYTSAFEASDKLKQNWPYDEEVWYEVLRVCVEGHDREKLKETIIEIKAADVNWSQPGKEKLEVWLKV